MRRSLEDDGDAAAGVEAVNEALLTGDAERLVLDRDHPSREELVRLALRHDVPIELLDGELEDLDGVCCRLRHRPLEY